MKQGEADERLGELFLALSRSAHGLARHNVGELDLTPAQARALAMLGHCGERVTMSQLAKRLHVVPRAVTPIADALERAGYIRREVDPNNRRATLLVLTGEGRSIAHRMRELRVRAAGELFAPLDAEERDDLLTLLDKVMRSQPEWADRERS